MTHHQQKIYKKLGVFLLDISDLPEFSQRRERRAAILLGTREAEAHKKILSALQGMPNVSYDRVQEGPLFFLYFMRGVMTPQKWLKSVLPETQQRDPSKKPGYGCCGSGKCSLQ